MSLPVGLEDAQPQQAEHGDEREVAAVRRPLRSAEQRLELQVGQAQGRRLGRHVRATDVLRR